MTEVEARTAPGLWLLQFKGCNEGGLSHKKIIDTFNNSKLCTRYTMTLKDAWCATAVSAAYIATGLLPIFPCVECSCENMIALAKKAGIWVENDGYVPRMGDIIMYSWLDNGVGDCTTRAQHTGIVLKTDFGGIQIVEGNFNDTVAIRSMPINGKYIRGFITPKFSAYVDHTNKELPHDKKYNGVFTVKAPLYLRTAAGAQNKAITVMAKNSSVMCDGYYQDVNGTIWVHVLQYKHNGHEYSGYCSAKYLDV